jgi:hypothetical protein
MIGARAGILPKMIGDYASPLLGGTDWKGSPDIPRGTDPWKAQAMAVGRMLANLAPIGVQTATQSAKTGWPGEALAAVGVRTTTATPLQEEFKKRQALIDQARRTPAELQTLNENYSQQLADNDKAVQDVYSGKWAAAGGKVPTHGQMDTELSNVSKNRPKYAEHINSEFSADLFGGDAGKQADFTKLIQQMHVGVAGSQMPADLPEHTNADEAYNAYWDVPEEKLHGLNPKQQAAARGKALVQWSLQNNVDYQTALDAAKAKAWGGAVPPKLPVGVTSETIDTWVSRWGDAADADAKRHVIDDVAKHYMPGDPHGADTVWQRIKLRMMPPQQPTELQVSRDKALDILFGSRDPQRFPRYQGPDGKPLGNDQMWAQFDSQIASGSKGSKAASPEVKSLMEAKSRAESAKKTYILEHMNSNDYERWFGLGKTMTEDQWQKYQKTGFPHYNDNGSMSKDKSGTVTDPKENLNRDRIEQQWQASTQAARNTTKVEMTVKGRTVNVTLQQAHTQILHTISKGWAKALDVPQPGSVQSEG